MNDDGELYKRNAEKKELNWNIKVPVWDIQMDAASDPFKLNVF